MKTKYKVVIFLIVVVLSCQKRMDFSFDTTNHKKYFIPELRVNILLPDSLVELDTQTYIKSVRQSKLDDNRKEKMIALLSENYTEPGEFLSFADPKDTYNCINFYPEQNATISASTIDTILSMMKGNLENRLKNDKHLLIEEKYFNNNIVKVLKIKYQYELEGNQEYLSEYLISNNIRTISATVYNRNKTVDFEREIRVIQFDSIAIVRPDSYME